MKTIGIIGGGVGGLSTAINLRLAGFEVELFEKNHEPGGKLAQHRAEGFSFDLGPTVLTMPFVLRSLFERAGRSLENYVQLEPVEPTCRYHWSDGHTFDAFTSGELLHAELRRAFPDDADEAVRFLGEIARLYDATRDIFLFNRFGLRELLRARNLGMMAMLPKLGLATSMHRSLSRRFGSEKLVQFFGRFATYNGSSPYRAPATLNVIPHVELAFGAWYPRGGMGEIARALAQLAIELGVRVHLGTAIDSVERGGAGLAAIHAGGARHAVDAVVSNVDVLWTYRHLLEPVGIATPRAVAAERSCSGYLMLMGVRGRHRDLAHHNVFFSDDYRGEFADIFDDRRLPRAMTVYVSIASKSDPSLAPEGCESWYVLMNAPARAHPIGADRSAEHEAFERAVAERLARFGLRPDIVWQSRLTPVDIEQRYNSVQGAIYGASSNSIFSAFLRPGNKAPRPGNLYFVGGSTHPGGGIPLALLSGDITARLIRKRHEA